MLLEVKAQTGKTNRQTHHEQKQPNAVPRSDNKQQPNVKTNLFI